MLDFSDLPLRSDPAILCEDITISKCVPDLLSLQDLRATKADSVLTPAGTATAR